MKVVYTFVYALVSNDDADLHDVNGKMTSKKDTERVHMGPQYQYSAHPVHFLTLSCESRRQESRLLDFSPSNRTTGSAGTKVMIVLAKIQCRANVRLREAGWSTRVTWSFLHIKYRAAIGLCWPDLAGAPQLLSLFRLD